METTEMRKIGTLRVEKEYAGETLVFNFVDVVKDADDKIVSKTTIGQWSHNTGLLPAAVQDKATQHGFLQKFGDALAGKKEYTVSECKEILSDMSANMAAGDWNKPGKTKGEKVKAVDEAAIDDALAANLALANMDRETAIALIRSLGLMKK